MAESRSIAEWEEKRHPKQVKCLKTMQTLLQCFISVQNEAVQDFIHTQWEMYKELLQAVAWITGWEPYTCFTNNNIVLIWTLIIFPRTLDFMQHARGISLTETFYYFIIICLKKKWRSTLMIFKCLWGLSNKYTHNKYICRTILFLLIYFCHRNVTSVYIQSKLSMHQPSKLYIDVSSPSIF